MRTVLLLLTLAGYLAVAQAAACSIGDQCAGTVVDCLPANCPAGTSCRTTNNPVNGDAYCLAYPECTEDLTKDIPFNYQCRKDRKTTCTCPGPLTGNPDLDTTCRAVIGGPNNRIKIGTISNTYCVPTECNGWTDSTVAGITRRYCVLNGMPACTCPAGSTCTGGTAGNTWCEEPIN